MTSLCSEIFGNELRSEVNKTSLRSDMLEDEFGSEVNKTSLRSDIKGSKNFNFPSSPQILQSTYYLGSIEKFVREANSTASHLPVTRSTTENATWKIYFKQAVCCPNLEDHLEQHWRWYWDLFSRAQLKQVFYHCPPLMHSKMQYT